MNAHRHLLYLFDQTDWRSRIPLAELARENGFRVTLALVGEKGETGDLPEGFDVFFIRSTPGKMNAPALFKMVRQIHTLLKKEQPHLIHTVTLKYAFITGLAALPFRKIRKIYTIAGLGYLFRSEGPKARLLRSAIAPLLKKILTAPHTHVTFQNPDDLQLMISSGFADPGRSILILGSGVDLEKFAALPFSVERPPLVLMPTRLVREKGAEIFVQAARMLKAKGIEATFKIAGGLTKHNPSAHTQEEMDSLTADGAVEWLGHVSNMPSLLARANVIVYPSWYGEGIPRVLLEAAAIGRPIITTDHPGCREVVVHSKNGFLVPIKDAAAIADALERLLSDPEKQQHMGQESRLRAQEHFDIRLITRQTLDVYAKALAH